MLVRMFTTHYNENGSCNVAGLMRGLFGQVAACSELMYFPHSLIRFFSHGAGLLPFS